MKRACRRRILGDLQDACVELFRDYRLPRVMRAAAPDGAVDFAGRIEFDGDELRGSLSVVATRSLLDDMRGRGHACQDDWVAELANQMAGRLKLKLIRRGVVIRLGTPRLFRNGEASALARRDRSRIWLRSGAGVIGLKLETIVSEDFTLEGRYRKMDLMREGEIQHFD